MRACASACFSYCVSMRVHVCVRAGVRVCVRGCIKHFHCMPYEIGDCISAEYVTQLPQTSELDSFGGLFCDFLSWIQT